MSLGANLKRLRTERGITQTEIAKMLNIDRTTYSKYETGDSAPDYDKLVKLAHYFNVTTDELLGNSTLKENMNPDIRAIARAGLTDEQAKQLKQIAEVMFPDAFRKKKDTKKP